MAELGEQSQKLHYDVIKYINESCISFTLAIGEDMQQPITANIEYGSWHNSRQDLIKELGVLMREDSVLLVKGSRSMKMEEIIQKSNS